MPELNQEPNKEGEQAAEFETEKGKHGLKGKIDKRTTISIIAAVVALFIVFNIGKSAGINSEVVSIKIQQDEEYQDASKKLDKIYEEIKEKNDSIIAAEKYYDNRDALDKELTENTELVTRLTEDYDALKKEIAVKKDELEKLTGEILKAKGSPIKLPAGYFTVGRDIESGRYIVTGDSNFVVRSVYGDLKVNTILGGGYGVDSFVCELNTGDELKCNGSDSFTPIE